MSRRSRAMTPTSLSGAVELGVASVIGSNVSQ
jgi:hypothetical protein